MAGIYDSDFDHNPHEQVLDALGQPLYVGMEVAHIAKIASRTRVSRRKILAIDHLTGTMTISPGIGVRFETSKVGRNVRGANVLRLCQCQQ